MSSGKSVSVSLRLYDKKQWGALQFLGHTHLVCAEKFEQKNGSYSFIGGHRVRLFKLTGNVNWHCVDSHAFAEGAVKVDITNVPPQTPPRRKQGG